MNNVLIFEILIILFSFLLYLFMKIKKYKNVEKKFFILFISILFFEFMSEPMWEFKKLDSWAYIWKDLPWIIVLGWVSIFLITFVVVDGVFKSLPEKKKFWIYLILIEIIVAPIEIWLLNSGIKTYDPILTNTFSGLKIPFTNAPLEILVAIPLFATLVICLYKYLNYLYINR